MSLRFYRLLELFGNLTTRYQASAIAGGLISSRLSLRLSYKVRLVTDAGSELGPVFFSHQNETVSLVDQCIVRDWADWISQASR
jgi:hypothetical protein